MRNSHKFAARMLVSIVLPCATFACSGSDDTAVDKQPSGQIEIFSWWVSGGEVDALNAVLDLNQEKYPKTKVKNLTEDLADEARQRLEQRMAQGAPPDTFQANVGADLFKWVLFNGVDDKESKVEPLNAIAEANGWFDVFPKSVTDALSHNGSFYGVPANIHRLNSLFYNTKLFEREGLTPPDTRDELLTVSKALKAKGYVPLCIGSDHWWTLSLLAFENIFPSVAGGDYYLGYWTGKKTPDSAQVNAALDYLEELWPYFNEDANSLDWTTGIDHMFDSTNPCAMTVMGDWAKGYLEKKGWEAGTDFAQIPFPGSRGTFVFTADTFPLPKGAPNRPGAVALLETFASVEGQIAFNRIKGSIPVRTDIDPKEFDSIAQKTMADFTKDQLVSAMSGLLPQDSFGDLGPALKEMLSSGDREGVLNALANDYAMLK
ncbi:MAG TPA: ABC transporter substrate-binding protein [Polyangiaceae bacterium]|nr:ABC transporter substrate-binding protein [Polyangiaceae bacterium]